MLTVLGLAAAAAAIARHEWLRPGPLPHAEDVVVPHGTVAGLAAFLAARGVIAGAARFRIAALLTRGDGALHAAELRMPAHASLASVLAVLRHGVPVQHSLTIPEGLTAAQIARLIDAAPALSGPAVLPPEGAILPQTYAFVRGTPRATVLARAEAAMQAALASAWGSRQPGLLLASPAQAVALASLVEQETPVAAERAHVASVFLNRLRLGMRLQSDPTAAYAAAGGLLPLGRALTRADLAFDNPYNTYRIPALPPGPICAPGLAALQAVLHPLPGEDLYFVADGSGGHAFAATLAQHERNVADRRNLH